LAASRVVDPTWDDPEDAFYLGVAFDRIFVATAQASGHPGIRPSGHPGIRASGHPGSMPPPPM